MRRVISLILSIAMVASLATGLAVSSFAAEPGGVGYTFNDDINKLKYTVTKSGEVKVEKKDTSNKPTGELIIPATVTDGFDTYNVTSIYNSGFKDCKGLTRVTIPNSITTIGQGAFTDCTSLTDVTIGSGVNNLGPTVFQGCTSLISINVENGNTVYTSTDGVLYSSNGKCLYCYPAAKAGESFEIPNGITSIGAFSFSGCQNLTSVTIPSSVNNIIETSFQNCINLTSIHVNKENTSYKAENEVLYSKDGKKIICYPASKIGESFEIPNGVTYIAQSAFYGCKNLTSVTIPDSVTTVGIYAFYDCKNLTNVTIGNGVTNINNYTFQNCKNLATVTMGNNVESIGESSFDYCTDLTSITIPDSVKTINNTAFYGCTGLVDVTIGNGITSIGDYAFYDCKSLTNVYINAKTPPTLGTNALKYYKSGYQIFADLIIYVPANSVEAYKASWTDYTYKITATNAGPAVQSGITINSVAIEEVNKSSYDIGTLTLSGDGNTVTVDKIDANTDVEINIPSDKTLVVSNTNGDAINAPSNNVTITGGGTLIVKAATGECECINAKTICIDGCTVNATSNNNGILTSGSITISKSVVTVNYSGGEASGIYSYEGSITITTDSIVLVEATGNSGTGIYADNDIDIDNSTAKVKNDKIKAFYAEGKIIVNGVTKTTDDLTSDTDGYYYFEASSELPISFDVGGNAGCVITSNEVISYRTTDDGGFENSTENEGKQLTLEKGNFYTISTTNGLVYINYVTKDVTITPEKDSLEEAKGTAIALRDILSSTSNTNTSNYALDASGNGKVVVPNAVYSAFNTAITNADEALKLDSPTQMVLDEALVSLNKAQVAFLNSLRANTHYKNGNGISYTDLDAVFSQYFEMTSVSANRTSGSNTYYAESVTLRYSPTNYSIHYTIYKDSNDEAMIKQMIANETKPSGGETGGGDKPHEDPKPIKVSQNDGKFNIQNILGSGYNIHSIYYTLGTSTDDKDYFAYIYKANNPLSEVSVLGNGVHTFKIYATKDGVTGTYSMEVEAEQAITGPIAVKQNGVVFINFNGTTPSKISYVKGQDTIYIPIEDKIKLDATEFDGVETIKFDEIDVTIE